MWPSGLREYTDMTALICLLTRHRAYIRHRLNGTKKTKRGGIKTCTEWIKIHFVMGPLSLKPGEQVRKPRYLGFGTQVHITSITLTAFYYLKNVSKVKSILSQSNAETLVYALNSCISDFPKRLWDDSCSFKMLQSSHQDKRKQTHYSHN